MEILKSYNKNNVIIPAHICFKFFNKILKMFHQKILHIHLNTII